MKIKVRAEGREGVYLLTKENAIEFINGLEMERIHNFVGAPPLLVGCDWDKQDVADLINKEETLQALLLEPNFTLAHQLVCTTNTKRYMFDVGAITTDDIEVQNESQSETKAGTKAY